MVSAAADPFAELLEQVAGKLTAAGLAATVDPAALPPFVLVDLGDSTGAAVGIGAWPASVLVRVVATPPLDLGGHRWLTATLSTVLGTLGFAPFTRGTIDHVGKPCPTITVAYPLEAANPNC